MDRTFGKPPSTRFIWPAIIAAYLITVGNLIVNHDVQSYGMRCNPVPSQTFAFIALQAIVFVLIAYVAIVGKWRVLWLTPQLLLFVLTLLMIADVTASGVYAKHNTADAKSPPSKADVCFLAF